MTVGVGVPSKPPDPPVLPCVDMRFCLSPPQDDDQGGRMKTVRAFSHAPRVVTLIVSVALVSIGWRGDALAVQGDCNQPVSTGSSATATDCLFILQAAVGAQICSPECICAPTGNLPISATNALFCLTAVVTPGTPLNCPCQTTTSTITTTTLGGTTTTSTTVGATTTTTLEQCPAVIVPGEVGVPVPCGCIDSGSEGFPQCDGTCDEDEACVPDFEEGGCYCEEFGCGLYEGGPQCYGLCDDDDKCVETAEGCECVDEDDPRCDEDDLSSPAVAGDVPVAAICTAQCGDATAPQCNGGCPAGQFCHDIFSGGCGCVQVTCGSFAGPPLCAGVCPPPAVCFDFGGTCGCTATIPD
jgi:hypothetical protein